LGLEKSHAHTEKRWRSRKQRRGNMGAGSLLRVAYCLSIFV